MKFVLLLLCLVLRLPLQESLYVRSQGDGLCVYSSLQDGHSPVNSSTPYPAGAKLTLTCNSEEEVYWANGDHSLDAFEQSAAYASYQHVRNLTIPKLTADHDNLYLKCFQHKSINSAEVRLNVLSPPRLSINLLSEENSFECNVTENWKPELQLCIRTAGDWNCKNESRIVLNFGPDDEKPTVTCRANLRIDVSSLNQQTMQLFEKMFEDTQVVQDLSKGLFINVTSSLQDGPVGANSSVPYPAGTKLTLSCRSHGEVFWADKNHSLDVFEQFTSTVNGQHVRNLTIPELTADHDNLDLKCFEHQSSDSVQIKLNVLSPPELSIAHLDGNFVECKITKNWNDVWQLCISTAGDWNCQNDPGIVANISSVDGNSKASCRAGLQTLPRLGTLNQQAMRGFEKMVSESQVRIGEDKYSPGSDHTMTPTSVSTSSEFPESDSPLMYIIVGTIIVCIGVLVIFIIVYSNRWKRFCINKLKSYRKHREDISNRDKAKSPDEQESLEMS